MELKDQIRIAREAKGWDQAELAKRAGVSKTSVTYWENGKGIKIGRLQQLETLLGVTLNATGKIPDGLPSFVTPQHLEMLAAYNRLPLRIKNAINELILFHAAGTKNHVDAFFEDGIQPSGDLNVTGSALSTSAVKRRSNSK
ncbi:helix-turn-helix domain-containing protein [Novimethylophilus kurashikiensis]|uniref:helix-turn-helix domain-containing protein n=1 Tax=Novimethylophilus kurashikiensis TaxID=1825523 RepID=UPI000D58FC37|nr:helix-turn-helix transcriptional regulator [Novimethylophilus kurashikiensis]